MGHGKCQTDEELDAVLEKVERCCQRPVSGAPRGGGRVWRAGRGARRRGGTHDGQRRTGLHARGARPEHRRSAGARPADRRNAPLPSSAALGKGLLTDTTNSNSRAALHRSVQGTAAAHDAARDTNLCRRRSERLRRLGVGGGSAAASTRGGGGGGTSASSAFPIGGDAAARRASAHSRPARRRGRCRPTRRGRSARGRAPGGAASSLAGSEKRQVGHVRAVSSHCFRHASCAVWPHGSARSDSPAAKSPGRSRSSARRTRAARSAP